jgi:ferredoxin
VGLEVSYRLRVNPIACTGHGVCAELLPELIELDPWGYPILWSPAIPVDVLEHAKRAVDACPTLALIMEEVATGPPLLRAREAGGQRGSTDGGRCAPI